MPEARGNSIKSLSMPSPEMAENILRRVDCNQRLDGSIYVSGLGSVPARILDIQELYDLLSGMGDFSLNFSQVQQWVGEVLGDKEAAARIGDALHGKSPDQARAALADLLGERIAQCRAVLEVAAEVRQGQDSEGHNQAQ